MNRGSTAGMCKKPPPSKIGCETHPSYSIATSTVHMEVKQTEGEADNSPI
jgi:hypothetical protein